MPPSEKSFASTPRVDALRARLEPRAQDLEVLFVRVDGRARLVVLAAHRAEHLVRVHRAVRRLRQLLAAHDDAADQLALLPGA
ncbi:MAG: hypothetical protein KY393_03800, partial [Actinobacteria bacterium]|nr:hypothetical protein [Actinomycetota bacterium]